MKKDVYTKNLGVGRLMERDTKTTFSKKCAQDKKNSEKM